MYRDHDSWHEWSVLDDDGKLGYKQQHEEEKADNEVGSKLYLIIYFGTCSVCVALLYTAPGVEWNTRAAASYAAVLLTTWVLFTVTFHTDPGYVEKPTNADPNIPFPPLRTVYCKEVGQYVATYDHFCVMIDTPIGEKNHCKFFCLVLSQTVLTIHSVALVHHSDSLQGWILAVFLWPFGLGFLSLAVRHACWMLLNVTTYECMASHRVEYLQGSSGWACPFSAGVIGNLRLFCFENGFKLLFTQWSATGWVLTEPLVHDASSRV